MNTIFYRLWRILNLSRDAQLSIIRLFQDKFLIGVTGIVFNEKNEILLFKHTYRSNPWGLPGGYLNAKEHPITALEREIEEESGLVVSIENRLSIKIDKETACLDIGYLGTFIGGQFRPSDEVSEYGLFTMQNLPLLSRNQLILIDHAVVTKNPLVRYI